MDGAIITMDTKCWGSYMLLSVRVLLLREKKMMS